MQTQSNTMVSGARLRFVPSSIFFRGCFCRTLMPWKRPELKQTHERKRKQRNKYTLISFEIIMRNHQAQQKEAKLYQEGTSGDVVDIAFHPPILPIWCTPKNSYRHPKLEVRHFSWAVYLKISDSRQRRFFFSGYLPTPVLAYVGQNISNNSCEFLPNTLISSEYLGFTEKV